ncbi:MAG TPA: S9 family peptidase [Chitinophagaceae bacterium]|nr:S9 family peptidase [Chitinophagaceae bacterium]
MKKMLYLLLFFTCLSAVPLFAQNKQITIADIYKNHTFQAENIAGFNSMKDGRYYTEIDDEGNLVKKSFVTGNTTDTLVRADEIKTPDGKTLQPDNYQFCKDESKILINTRIHHIYRRSYSAISYVYDLKTKKLYQVSPDPVLHADFSPDGSKVAYVRNNDLYYRDLTTGKETRVTHDGRRNHIINGNCDWVYEEEFEFTRAFQWSPQGDKIAYYRFDESRVPLYTIPFYTDTSNYPTLYTYKYPKAGEPNSIVTIHVFDLNTGKKQNMDVGKNTDQYIPRIKWTTDNNTLCIFRMNRLQNKLELLLDNAATGQSRVLYTDTDKWYIDETLLDDLFFLKDGKHFIIVNEGDGWQHAYLYDMQGHQIHKLTAGHWDVDKIAGIDQVHSRLYFTAAYHSPMDRQLFSVNFNGKKLKQLTSKRGWHTVQFNADQTYYLDNYSNINTPPVFTICDHTGKVIRQLQDNLALRYRLSEYDLSKARFLKIPNAEGVKLNAYMLMPSDFDSTKKYPVLFMNYGGPGSQSVKDSWGTAFIWQQMLAEKGYIIVCVDNTGTGFRGEVFKKKYTYLQLGWKEIHDQMDAARWLYHHYSYVDSARIGHWGWSFGGFMSCLAITVGTDVFHTAIAVAPVTDWRYYDNIYTERYMRTPQENPKGYDKTSPINYAKKLKGKFLIIHGTGDDNVHFQNSTMFSEALRQADKQFAQAYYPNNNHGIYGGNTRMQLFTRMTNFILKNL